MRRRRSYKYAIPRAIKVSKYSNETYGAQIELQHPGGGNTSPYIAKATLIDVGGASNVLGTRKVKNFTISLSINQYQLANGDILNNSVMWALVFVPQGTTAGDLYTTQGADVFSLFEPNQNVIMSGLINGQTGVLTKYSPLSRNLNYGDKVIIILQTADGWNQGALLACKVNVQLNFALTFR